MAGEYGEGLGTGIYVNTLYREVQHFRQRWLWILLLVISSVSIWCAVQQLFLGKPFGNNPAPDSVVIIIAVIFGFGFPFVFYKINLSTAVRADGIYYRLFPFHFSFHKIRLEDIINYEVRTYSPLKDYGGWGIRHGPKGKAYNVSGNRGVQLELSNGDRLLFGSRKPEQLVQAIASALDAVKPDFRS
ncbi:DUF6141 family protein [Chloroflexota bacterium]